MTTILAALALGLPQLPPESLDAWAGPAGLQIVRLKQPAGDVVVYLPSRIGAGDLVSGSVFVEPAGTTSSELSANQSTLLAQTIDVMGTTVQVERPSFTVRAPEDGSPITMLLRSEQGDIRGTSSSAEMGLATDEPAACPVVEYGSAIRVVGRFDGSRETTMAWIDDQMVGVLAEGSRDCVLSTLNFGVGPHRLRIKEGERESEHMVNIVRVDVKAPQDARVGRTTAIEVIVDGLESADPSAYPLSVVLTNDMPKFFPFGSETVLTVESGDVVDGRYMGKVEFKPKGKGNFSMSARLVCEGFLKRIGL